MKTQHSQKEINKMMLTKLGDVELDAAEAQSPRQDPTAQVQGQYYSQGYSRRPSKEHRQKLIHKAGTHTIVCSWSEPWPRWAGSVCWSQHRLWAPYTVRRARLSRPSCSHPRHNGLPRPCGHFSLYSPSSCILSTCPGLISNRSTLGSLTLLLPHWGQS